MLASDVVSCDVVDPDEVGVAECNRVSAPDVLGIEFLDSDVLDDNVGGAVGDVEAFALDDTAGADAYEGLMGCYADWVEGCVVIVYRDSWGGSLIVAAPLFLLSVRLIVEFECALLTVVVIDGCLAA